MPPTRAIVFGGCAGAGVQSRANTPPSSSPRNKEVDDIGNFLFRPLDRHDTVLLLSSATQSPCNSPSAGVITKRSGTADHVDTGFHSSSKELPRRTSERIQ